MVKVIRDGKTFEIDDSEDSLSAAKAKGYSPLLTVTKNGKETFDLNADDTDSVNAAFKKGYMEVDAFKHGQQPKAERSPILSAIQGAASSMAFGLDDEIGGFATAAAKGLTGNGFDYEAERDKIRASKKELEEANPLSYLGGGLAAGLIAPGGAAAKVGTGLLERVGVGAVTGAAQGGISGYGDSDAKDFSGQLADAAKGAAIGGTLGGTIGGVIKPRALSGEVSGFAKDVGDSVSPYVKGASKAFKEGAEDAKKIPILGDLPVVGSAPAQAIGGLKAAAKELFSTKAAISEQRKLAEKVVAEGGQPRPGFSQNMSDVDVIASRAMAGGEYNSVADWIAKESSNFGVDEGSFKKLLKMTPERLKEVADFSKREAADDAAPLFQNLKDTFESVRSDRMKELKGQARKEFSSNADETLGSLQSAYKNAGELKTTLGAQNVIDDAYDILRNGKGSDVFGFEPGHVDSIDQGALFDRLQAARSHLDDNIDWTSIKKGNRSATPVEKTLMKVRDQIDQTLKGGSEAKIESDSLFRTSKNLENRFFKLASDKDGQHEVSLSKLFGDNDKAVKAKEFLKEVEDFAARPDLPEAMRETTKALADNLRGAMDTAGDKRIFQEFSRKTRGPTGPSVERNANILGDRNIAQQALVTPATYLDLKVQMPALAKDRFGKTYSDLNQFEQRALLQFVSWKQGRVLQGDPLTPQVEAAIWAKILENVKK